VCPSHESAAANFRYAEVFSTLILRRLLNKLSAYGFRGALFNWLSDFSQTDSKEPLLTVHSVLGGEKITSGEPQASVLGPLLFLIFINNLSDDILSCTKLFANDAKVYNRVDSVQDKLQLKTANVLNWSS